MSQHSPIKHVTATLAAAACLAFASGVGAADVNEDQMAFAEPFSAICHPAYLPCQKWPSLAYRVDKASAAPEVLIAQASTDPASGVCHPARQSCAARANPRSSVSK